MKSTSNKESIREITYLRKKLSIMKDILHNMEEENLTLLVENNRLNTIIDSRQQMIIKRPKEWSSNKPIPAKFINDGL